MIGKELGCDLRTLMWDTKNGSIGRIFLKHALLVSDVMVAIELSCGAKGIRLLTERELAQIGNRNGDQERFRWSINVAGQKLSAVPDRVFALELVGADGTARRSYFFLEADRGTMPVVRKTLFQTSFFRKLLAYEATWADRLHEKLFGFHRFRVLTVTTNAKRVQSLVEACSKLKAGHGLFLFADAAILNSPRDILSHPCRTGRPGETAQLLS